MNDYINAEEIKILMKGLDLYEGEPVTSNMTGSLIEAMLMGGRRSPEETEKATEASIAKASAECDKRKLSVLRLRVKLLEMSQQPSEFAK